MSLEIDSDVESVVGPSPRTRLENHGLPVTVAPHLAKALGLAWYTGT